MLVVLFKELSIDAVRFELSVTVLVEEMETQLLLVGDRLLNVYEGRLLTADKKAVLVAVGITVMDSEIWEYIVWL